jgi:antitoxin VapB
MAFNIKDPETDQLARDLAAATGESLTDAVRAALRDRLERQTRRGKGVAAEIRRIQARLARLPLLDNRSPEKIVEYNTHGVPR